MSFLPGKPERHALKLRIDFPENLITTTAIADIHTSQGATITDVTSTVTSDAITSNEPGPSSEDMAVDVTGPEIESNSDVTAFINDGSQGEGSGSTNDETIAEEIYNNENSPDIIFYSWIVYDPNMGPNSVNHISIKIVSLTIMVFIIFC